MTGQGPSVKGGAAIIVGNMLKWFDFGIFAFMTRSSAPRSASSTPRFQAVNSILATTATFGAGFLMRPIGAIRTAAPPLP